MKFGSSICPFISSVSIDNENEQIFALFPIAKFANFEMQEKEK